MGKGAGTAVPHGNADRAPCPPKMLQLALTPLVGTAHARLSFVSKTVPAPLPTLQDRALRSVKRKSAPVSALGQGIALISLLPSPSQSRGMARRQGALPGLLRAGVRITPDDEVHLRCTPRLAARQRGILAFMPLTVVGPGRLVVAGEAARVRPGDGGCVRPSLAGAAPAPRSQDAS